MVQYEIEFYEKGNGEAPAEEFMRKLDDKIIDLARRYRADYERRCME